MIRWFLWGVLALSTCVGTLPAAAQFPFDGAAEPASESEQKPESGPALVAELEERLEVAEAELAALEADGSVAVAATPQAEHLSARRSRLEGIRAALRATLDSRREPEAPDQGVLLLEESVSLGALLRLHEAHAAELRRLEDQGAARAASLAARTSAREQLADAERARRAARALQEESPSPVNRRALELAELDARLGREKLAYAEAELSSDRAAVENSERQVAELIASVRTLRDALHDAAEPIDLAEAAQALGLEADAKARSAARRRAERALANATEQERMLAESPDERIALASARLARQLAVDRLSAHEASDARAERKRTWLERWAVLLRDETTPAEARAWAEEADEAAHEAERDLRQRQGRLAELNERVDGARVRLGQEGVPDLERVERERQLAGLRESISFHISDMGEIARHRRLAGYFRDDVNALHGRLDLRTRLAEGFSVVRSSWGAELTSVDDDPITVGNAVLAFLLLLLGFGLSRQMSRVVGRVIEKRVGLQPGVGSALEAAIFYTLLVTFALLALRSVNVPLTAFAFLGGALAIGVGFGSQTIMNNFISGLILMLERPVRVRDLIEVEGTHGVIEAIGARSTRIRATDGRHIIVPNGFFLQNNVVNWTLSDEMLRTKVVVGVIYGSPTRLVEQLIRAVLDANPRVIQSPRPVINFAEFGDNSLNFETYFWLRARSPMAAEQLKSEIRFAIDDAFRAHDLVIAFPQRDVHLDTAAPLDIRVLPAREEAGE